MVHGWYEREENSPQDWSEKEGMGESGRHDDLDVHNNVDKRNGAVLDYQDIEGDLMFPLDGPAMELSSQSQR